MRLKCIRTHLFVGGHASLLEAPSESIKDTNNRIRLRTITLFPCAGPFCKLEITGKTVRASSTSSGGLNRDVAVASHDQLAKSAVKVPCSPTRASHWCRQHPCNDIVFKVAQGLASGPKPLPACGRSPLLALSCDILANPASR